MRDEPAVYVVEGRRFRLELGKAGGVCVVRISRGELTVKGFPAFHLTRIDLADLVHPRAAPYAVFPETGTRAIRSVNVRERTGGIEIAVEDSYRFFEGEVRWLLDAEGRGEIRYDYAYSGPSLKVREIGIRVPIHRSFDTLRWRRWSEWGVFPPDHISRTCGTANARRDIRLGAGGEEQPPSWAWALDQTALGTNDFRSVKFNIYEACLESEEGNPALTVAGDADVHVRACLDAKTNDVLFHLLDRCRLGPRVLDRGDRISGGFDVRL